MDAGSEAGVAFQTALSAETNPQNVGTSALCAGSFVCQKTIDKKEKDIL